VDEIISTIVGSDNVVIIRLYDVSSFLNNSGFVMFLCSPPINRYRRPCFIRYTSWSNVLLRIRYSLLHRCFQYVIIRLIIIVLKRWIVRLIIIIVSKRWIVRLIIIIVSKRWVAQVLTIRWEMSLIALNRDAFARLEIRHWYVPIRLKPRQGFPLVVR